MNDSPGRHSDAIILIADDDPTTRFMLGQALIYEGYQTIEATDGVEALQLIGQMQPNLVLLDALMPGLDGFEVCLELQQLPETRRPPVLMITGLENRESVDRAFAVGAVDYITKPIQWAVLRQRIRRLLHTQQLERFREDLTHMVIHDMKNPLSVIKGYAELTIQDLRGQPSEEWVTERLMFMQNASENLLQMVMMLLDVARMQERQLTLKRTRRLVIDALREVQQATNWTANTHAVTLTIDCPDLTLTTILDWPLIHRVLINLVTNAVKHSPAGSTIVLGGFATNESPASACLFVQDRGEGIALADQARIFEKFTQASQRQYGSLLDTGLGLTFCKLATEAHGGMIRVESALGQGAKFILQFPVETET
ncbi:MAG: hybrid sensor histidine kinase/response regulator [Aggregatilineales bacterium]